MALYDLSDPTIPLPAQLVGEEREAEEQRSRSGNYQTV